MCHKAVRLRNSLEKLVDSLRRLGRVYEDSEIACEGSTEADLVRE